MSLLDAAMDNMVMMDKKSGPDGEGGILNSWAEGAPFSAAVTFDSSMEARAAQKQGVTSLYTVHDVFKRLSDGKIFRVTSDGDDKFTPQSSSLDMRQVTAEEWRLT